MIEIRPETPADTDAIARVTAAAFADVEHSDQSEPAIIAGLRAAGALTASLVAVDGGEVVGHIAASPVHIDGAAGPFVGLGPLSVLPARQGEGIGSALMHRILAEVDAEVVVLLGEPEYYRRFGFAPVAGLRFPGAPAEYFLARVTRPVRGVVTYHPAFGG